MPRYAISDIHGCAKTFDLLLRQIDFGPEDELYLLGDYVDRGPDSPGVIHHIMRLQENGFLVKALMGNHEEMTLNEYRRAPHLRHGYPDQQIRWMMNLPSYLEIPGYILVHAGLSFSGPDPLNDREAMRWIRYWHQDLDREWLGDRRIVHGHTPQSYVEVIRDTQHVDELPVICIDAGCAFQRMGLGYLVALDLDSLAVHTLRRVEIV